MGLDGHTLTLLPGSVIVGQLSIAGSYSLVIGNGLSIANNFAGGALPSSINTNGAPFAVLGTQIAVVDPSGIAFLPTMFNDLSNGIFGSIQSRLNGFGGVNGAGANGGFAPPSLLAPPLKDATPASTGYRYQAWAEVFGGLRHQEASRPTVAVNHRVGASWWAWTAG